MIGILPVASIVGLIAVWYAASVAAIVALIWQFGTDPAFWSSVGIAFSGSTVLNGLLLFMVYIGWRRLWRWFPSLNRLLFPDANGSWTMVIHWRNGARSGVANAVAVVRQDLLRISMEVSSDASDSETLMAYAKRDPESGRSLLYYVYRVIPKNVDGEASGSYEGAAILRLSNTDPGKLGGNYFTSRRGTGYFELSGRREIELKS